MLTACRSTWAYAAHSPRATQRTKLSVGRTASGVELDEPGGRNKIVSLLVDLCWWHCPAQAGELSPCSASIASSRAACAWPSFGITGMLHAATLWLWF